MRTKCARNKHEKLDIEQDEEEESSENKVPILSVREQTISADGTIWVPKFPAQNERASKK